MRSKLPVITALLAGAVIALVAVLVVGGGDDDKDKTSASSTTPQSTALADGTELKSKEFKLRYPNQGWEQLTSKDLGNRARGTVAGLKREDNGALVLVQRGGKLEASLDEIANELTTRLKKEVEDFRFVSSEQVKLPAGDAVTYTFVRTKSDRVQNLVVIPEDDRTFTLNSVIGGGSKDAAREVAEIVKTFDPEN